MLKIGLKKEEWFEVIESLKKAAIDVVDTWHERTIQHIRLESANAKHLQDHKNKLIEQARIKAGRYH